MKVYGYGNDYRCYFIDALQALITNNIAEFYKKYNFLMYICECHIQNNIASHDKNLKNKSAKDKLIFKGVFLELNRFIMFALSQKNLNMFINLLYFLFNTKFFEYKTSNELGFKLNDVIKYIKKNMTNAIDHEIDIKNIENKKKTTNERNKIENNYNQMESELTKVLNKKININIVQVLTEFYDNKNIFVTKTENIIMWKPFKNQPIILIHYKKLNLISVNVNKKRIVLFPVKTQDEKLLNHVLYNPDEWKYYKNNKLIKLGLFQHSIVGISIYSNDAPSEVINRFVFFKFECF